MTLIQQSSPHLTNRLSTRQVMLWVIAMTLPGLAGLSWFFGFGSLVQVILASLFAVFFEALFLAIRRRPILFYLGDCSALLTGVLLGLALPAYCPWWVNLMGVGFAVIVTKQLYGGLGFNPFNPAMAGYALVLVSFPVAMTTSWATPQSLLEVDPPGLIKTLQIIFEVGPALPDAYTMATPLDVYKHDIASATASELWTQSLFGQFAALGWEVVNILYLLGGLVLVYRGIITWHTPAGVIGDLGFMSLLVGWDVDQHVPTLLHLFGGATMLGAFFIATDPVSSATSPLGKLIFGAGVGVLTFLIRTYGAYPDAIAFAVLLMNFAAPFIDYYSQPRTYGHSKPKRGIGKSA